MISDAATTPGSGHGLGAWVSQDWEANGGRPDAQVILAWFRLCQWVLPRRRLLGSVVAGGYGLVVVMLFGVELLPSTEVGPGLQLPHPQTIVINPRTRIGAGCLIRHGVTIGNADALGSEDTPSPVLGDRVEIGAGAVIIGSVVIGDDARVGANAVVTADVASATSVAGVPARVISKANKPLS